jgi:regulator of RNase E activity RraA
MVKRGVSALITDGVVRDLEGVLGTGLPVWCDGYAAPPSVAGLTFVGWGEAIGCGGVAVFPNDVVVADQDPMSHLPLPTNNPPKPALIISEVRRLFAGGGYGAG